MGHKKASFAILALSIFVLRTPPAHAQAATEPIEEIQVTATRRPAQSSDVSAAVTVIAEAEIQTLKLTTDALAARPGVFLQQTTPGQGAAIIRGLKGSEVLHLVDGFRLNNAIFRNAPTQYLALVSPGTVERIEVLRGSPASLYGSDAVGGVLQVITRIPEFDGGELAFRREISVGLDLAELERSLHASVDLGTERLAGLMSIGYLETGDRKTGGGDRIGPSGYTAESARAALSFTPDESSSWLIDLQYGRQPETPRVDELVPGFGETEPASEEFLFAPNERAFAHLRHDRNGAWLGADWVIDFGWQRIIDDRATRNFGADVRRLEANESDLFGLSITASRETAAGSWVAGAEYYHDTVSSRRIEWDLATDLRQLVQPRFPDGSTVDQAAIFAHLGRALGQRQMLSGGIRFSAVEVELEGSVFSPPADVDLEDVSADLGWSFSLTDTIQLVANLGYGFRAPNVFDLGTLGERPGNRFNIPNPDLVSERITQFDTGVRFRGARVDVEVVAWVLDYDDRIASVLTGAQTPDGRDVVQTQNRASARIRGFESVTRLALDERATAELVLNYTRGEEDDADGVTAPADRIPPLNGRLSVDFAPRAAVRVKPFLLFAAEQDRLSDRDVRDPRIDPDGTAGWLTANVEASWSSDGGWTVRLSALNLFDERYRVHGSGIDAPGRNLVLDVRYRW